MAEDAQKVFQRLPDRIKSLARNSLRIHTSPTPIDSLRLGQSRIGGVPDLPSRFEWPHYDGLALSFIAQFDLKELASQSQVLSLPTEREAWYSFMIPNSGRGGSIQRIVVARW
jgi:uncharacterized protein YwqG